MDRDKPAREPDGSEGYYREYCPHCGLEKEQARQQSPLQLCSDCDAAMNEHDNDPPTQQARQVNDNVPF